MQCLVRRGGLNKLCRDRIEGWGSMCSGSGEANRGRPESATSLIRGSRCEANSWGWVLAAFLFDW